MEFIQLDSDSQLCQEEDKICNGYNMYLVEYHHGQVGPESHQSKDVVRKAEECKTCTLSANLGSKGQDRDYNKLLVAGGPEDDLLKYGPVSDIMVPDIPPSLGINSRAKPSRVSNEASPIYKSLVLQPKIESKSKLDDTHTAAKSAEIQPFNTKIFTSPHRSASYNIIVSSPSLPLLDQPLLHHARSEPLRPCVLEMSPPLHRMEGDVVDPAPLGTRTSSLAPSHAVSGVSILEASRSTFSVPFGRSSTRRLPDCDRQSQINNRNEGFIQPSPDLYEERHNASKDRIDSNIDVEALLMSDQELTKFAEKRKLRLDSIKLNTIISTSTPQNGYSIRKASTRTSFTKIY